MPQTCAKRVRSVFNAPVAFNARLTHVCGTLLKQYLIKLERAWSVHWRASNVRQTRSKRIQRACSVVIRPGHAELLEKFLSMFKIFLIPNAHETRDDFWRHTETRARRIPSVHNVLVTRFERVYDVFLAYVDFCNVLTRPSRVSLIR